MDLPSDFYDLAIIGATEKEFVSYLAAEYEIQVNDAAEISMLKIRFWDEFVET